MPRSRKGLLPSGALTGLIIMVHQICGGAGAYLGAAIFDARGNYGAALWLKLFVSLAATLLTLLLRRSRESLAV